MFELYQKPGATAPKYRCQSEITDIFPALLAHKMHLITDWYSTKHNGLVLHSSWVLSFSFSKGLSSFVVYSSKSDRTTVGSAVNYTNDNSLVSQRFPLRVIQYGITQLLEVDLKK